MNIHNLFIITVLKEKFQKNHFIEKATLKMLLIDTFLWSWIKLKPFERDDSLFLFLFYFF